MYVCVADRSLCPAGEDDTRGQGSDGQQSLTRGRHGCRIEEKGEDEENEEEEEEEARRMLMNKKKQKND